MVLGGRRVMPGGLGVNESVKIMSVSVFPWYRYHAILNLSDTYPGAR